MDDINNYAKVLAGNAANSATLGFGSKYLVDKQMNQQYPKTALAGEIIGGLPLAALTGGSSLPAQMAINAGANAIRSYNEGDNVGIGAGIGALAPVAGLGASKLIGAGINAGRAIPGAILNYSKNLTPVQQVTQSQFADVLAHKDAYDTLQRLGKHAAGLMDSIKQTTDPAEAAAMKAALANVNRDYNAIQSQLSLSQDEVEQGIRHYVKNFVRSNELENLTTTNPERFMAQSNMSPEMYSALQKGIANVYSHPASIATTSRNVSQLIPSSDVGLQLLPKAQMSAPAAQGLASLANPSTATKQDFIAAYMSQNLPRYSHNLPVGEKVISQEAIDEYNKRMLQNEQMQRALSSAGNLLGQSAFKSGNR